MFNVRETLEKISIRCIPSAVGTCYNSVNGTGINTNERWIHMKTISESIRTLRRERGLTQEQLGEKLGVSSQSVSKWESGTTLPDVSMIIPLSSVFGVSTDVIFGVTPDSMEREFDETKRYCEDADVTNRECVERWKNIVARYPNSYKARFELAQALHCLAAEDDDSGDFTPAIEQYERIVEECTDIDIRADAVVMLVNDYNRTRKVAEAVMAAKCATPMCASREVLLAGIDESPMQREDTQILIDLCLHEISWHLINGRYETSEERINACRTAINVMDDIYYDGHETKNVSAYYRDAYVGLAREYARTGMYDEMYDSLKHAYDETDARESLPLGVYKYSTNKFVAAAEYTHDVDFHGHEWAYLAYWVSNEDFDVVRGEERFAEFEKSVRAKVEENGKMQLLEEWTK